MHTDRFVIRPLADAEVTALRALAEEIWLDHYTAIIGRAQIEYMLDQRYRAEILRDELAQDAMWWDLLLVDEQPKGYSSYFLGPDAGEMKLDKLYIHGTCQRLGYGQAMLERVLARARTLKCTKVVLAVNKRNENAIAAYLRWGFVIEQAVVKDIGGGFVMDDYIMARAV